MTRSLTVGSPLHFARKNYRSIRLCIEHEEFNQLTIMNKCPPSRIEDKFDQLLGSLVLLKIDLRSDYHQLKIREDKFAFRT